VLLVVKSGKNLLSENCSLLIFCTCFNILFVLLFSSPLKKEGICIIKITKKLIFVLSLSHRLRTFMLSIINCFTHRQLQHEKMEQVMVALPEYPILILFFLWEYVLFCLMSVCTVVEFCI
jgi:hypothetical protein